VHPLNTEYGEEAGVCIITKKDNAPNALHTIIYISSVSSFNQIDNTLINNCLEKYGANCICLLPEPNNENRLLIEAELKERYTTLCH
jgi:hypothetical protein